MGSTCCKCRNDRRSPDIKYKIVTEAKGEPAVGFCGLPSPNDVPAKGVSVRDIIPSPAERACDPAVAMLAADEEKLKDEAEARAKTAREQLLPGGRLPEAVAVFVEKRQEKDDNKVQHEQSAAATAWLIDALEAAPLDPDISEAMSIAKGVNLLLSCFRYTRNLKVHGQWLTLKEAANRILRRIGASRLAPLLTNDVVSRMDAATTAKFYGPHQSTTREKPSQRLATPELFTLLEESLDFQHPPAMAERVALHTVLILNHLVNDAFQKKMEGLARKAGCKFTGSHPKSYSRPLVKLYNDYVNQKSPRAAFILDGIRCLLTGPGVLSLQSAIGEINEAFDGLIQIKNPFTLPPSEREDRNHLLLINITIIFDSKVTLAEYFKRPATIKLLADQRVHPDGEPYERWLEHYDLAVKILQSPALANVIVKVCGEIQLTFESVLIARAWMHYAYDCVRAANPNALFDNFSSRGQSEEIGNTLPLACKRGQLKMAKIILGNGADVDAADDSALGMNPLYFAAQNNHPDVLEWLLENGANVDIVSKDLCTTPLWVAVDFGYTDIVAQLLAANADANKRRADVSGNTPLQIAVRANRASIVKLLLEAKADPDLEQTDKNGKRPLYRAAQYGFNDVIGLLLDAGAGVDTPIGTEGCQTPLYIAANCGQSKAVQQLLDAGATVDITTKDSKALTPLLEAAAGGHHVTAQKLLDAKADVDKTTSTANYGMSPLYRAAEKGHREVVKVLLNANATVDKATSDDGTTPLLMAAWCGHTEVVQDLLEFNADANIASTDIGNTPLFVAAEEGHSAIVKLLLSSESRIDTERLGDKMTALHAAVNNSRSEVVGQLLKARAAVNSLTSGGQTPLQLATEKGVGEEIHNQLKLAGAK